MKLANPKKLLLALVSGQNQPGRELACGSTPACKPRSRSTESAYRGSLYRVIKLFRATCHPKAETRPLQERWRVSASDRKRRRPNGEASRQSGSVMRPGSDKLGGTPGGASRYERRSHPGPFAAEIQPGDGPFQECGVVSTSPPPWLESRGLVDGVGLELLIGSFGGTTRERHRSHPKP